jgi:cyclase
MPELTPLAPGVHVWLDDHPDVGHPNAGVVVDEDGVTLIDTLCVASQWAPFAAAVEALGPPIRRVVLTSSHIPYVGGTSRFWRAGMYGSAQASAHLDQPADVAVVRALLPDLADQFDDELTTRPISHVVTQATYVSGAVMAVPVRGQMDENLVAVVPGADIVFAGALCSFGVTPVAFQGDPGAWADTLTEVGDLGTIIVPGHGPIGGPDELLAQQAYLWACVEADGDPSALAAGPWDRWPGREWDEPNVERAAMLARGDTNVPPSLLRRLGLT